MSDTKQKKIRELTAQHYQDIYSPSLSAKGNAIYATELRLFGEGKGKDREYYEQHPELYPDFKKIYAEELPKATNWKNKTQLESDLKGAMKDIAAYGLTAAVAASSINGIGTVIALNSLPERLDNSGNPEKQVILELKNSPANTAEAEIAKRLEAKAAQIREKHNQDVVDKTKEILETRKKEGINDFVTAGEVATGVVAAGHAAKIAMNANRRRKDKVMPVQTNERSL